MNPLSYENSGVKYDTLDAFKRACQSAAATTVEALASHGLSEPAGVRGESAYLIEGPDDFLAHVEEGLGTKNLVADAMLDLTGKSYYARIGIDTVATIVNDLITTGALPISVAMHAGVGDSAWFENQQRAKDLAEGFAEGCLLSNAVWGGGETPALKGVIDPKTIVLAGSAIGRIKPKSHRIVGSVRDGDAIVFLASSGVHTNGLTLCRAVADRLPQGYLTTMNDGRTFGEALLDPSVIYARFIAGCQAADIPLHYAAHVTGHGWRKLMRLAEPFVYEITHVPQPPTVFTFLMERGPIESARCTPPSTWASASRFTSIQRTSMRRWGSHRTAVTPPGRPASWRKEGDRKAVSIPSLSITFESDTLQVR